MISGFQTSLVWKIFLVVEREIYWEKNKNKNHSENILQLSHSQREAKWEKNKNHSEKVWQYLQSLTKRERMEHANLVTYFFKFCEHSSKK